MRCLLAEDDAQISRNLSDGLSAAGYTVDAVFDGREAIYFASEFSYEVAIVDLGLPICEDQKEEERSVTIASSDLFFRVQILSAPLFDPASLFINIYHLVKFSVMEK